MKAFLILEDGTVFEGTHIGASKEIISEIDEIYLAVIHVNPDEKGKKKKDIKK